MKIEYIIFHFYVFAKKITLKNIDIQFNFKYKLKGNKYATALHDKGVGKRPQVATTTAARSLRPRTAISILVSLADPVSPGGTTEPTRASSASSATRKRSTSSPSRRVTTTYSQAATGL